jgi:hypothetical protein
VKTFLIAFFALALAGCEQASWKGWVYPNGAVLTDDIPIGKYASLEECRQSARNILKRLNTYENGETVQGDYECGFKCKADSGLGGLNVCEKTER